MFRALLFLRRTKNRSGRGSALPGLVLGVPLAFPPALTHVLTLVLFLSCGLFASAKAEEIKLGGTGAALGTMRLVADAFQLRHPGVTVNVLPSMGSGGGLKALSAGALQLAVSSRALTEAEQRSGLAGTEYGQTALVFATSLSQKTDVLRLRDLIEIYAGRTNVWPDGKTLRLVLRPIGEADNEAIKSLSPAMREAKELAEHRKGMMFAITDQEAATAIEKIPGALGPSSLALILSEKRALKPLALDGVLPDAASMASGRYPLLKKMLIVTGPQTGAAARAFVQFLHSKEGRSILLSTGHWVK